MSCPGGGGRGYLLEATSKPPVAQRAGWISPSLVPVETFEKQLGVLAWALNDNMLGAGIVTMPMHTYNKGKLHLDQAKVLEPILLGNHNVDTTFSMLFNEVDARGQRPLTYHGRIVFASPIGDIKQFSFRQM